MDTNRFNDDWEKLAPKLAAMEKKNPFIVPLQYFENLQDQLKSRVVLEDLQAGANAYQVPPGYFEQLEEQLKSRIAIDDLIAARSGFALPEDYFENLPNQIESRIFAEKLKQQIPDEGFAVPEGYFTRLNERITENTGAAKPGAKIFSMQPWMQYAAAACITVMIGAGIFLNKPDNITGSGVKENKQEIALSDLSNDEIINYLQLHSEDGDTHLILENLGNDANLSDVDAAVTPYELQQYLTNTL